MRTPNFIWIPENWQRIVAPILNELDPNTRAQVKHDLDEILKNPDDPPFACVEYRGSDFVGGRVALVCDGRVAVLYRKLADHPVLECRNILDADKFGEGTEDGA